MLENFFIQYKTIIVLLAVSLLVLGIHFLLWRLALGASHSAQVEAQKWSQALNSAATARRRQDAQLAELHRRIAELPPTDD